MKKLALLSVFLALPLLLPAQTAKVIQLPDNLAKQAKALYQEKADVEKKIADLQQQITDAYLKQSSNWSFGFEFSEDFRFIVPKSYTPLPSGSGTATICPTYPNWNYVVPAYGSYWSTAPAIAPYINLTTGLISGDGVTSGPQ
jgi:hypothetical protein